jgi:Holliday junction resolvase RusA-like endonuclease
MTTIKIKPLSTNTAWQGRRFKSQAYKAFEKEMMYLLPKLKIPEGELTLSLEVGLSNRNSDLDNTIKQLIDCLASKYNFNDSRIYGILAVKKIVPKGEEYIRFTIK